MIINVIVIKMKKKMICIFICITLLTIGSVSATINIDIDSENNIGKNLGNRLFVFGRMEKINYTGVSIDFEIVTFLFIKDGKEIIKIDNGEKIRFFAPMVALLFRKMVIGYFSDWLVIE